MRVIIEGMDGSGKSTLIKNLKSNWFPDRYVIDFFDPGISSRDEHNHWQEIRSFLKQTDMSNQAEVLMFFSMRAELMAEIEKVSPHADVIQDRGPLSTYVYQGILKNQSFFIQTLENSIDFCKPDLTIVLNAPYDLLRDRLEKRLNKDTGSNLDKFKSSEPFRKKVWEAYQTCIENDPSLKVVDCSGTEKEVLSKVLSEVKKVIDDNRG